MNTLDELLTEIEQEAAATGRLLDRLPADRLTWRPHPKSMTLGQLGLHVATIPSGFAAALENDQTEAEVILNHPECNSLEEIRQAWARNLTTVREKLRSDTVPNTAWSVAQDGKALLTLPKSVAHRMLMLSHWYHHRGQLTVYLRLLDVPLPSVYGPSADENPFG